MEVFGQLPETPDLSGQVTILSYRPAFNGPYSCIYRGQIRETGELVALKVLNALEGAALHTMQRKLERERRIWGAMKHNNILPLYGFADDEEIFQPFGALISPWLHSGDASKFLAENGHAMTMIQRFELWEGVIAGVNYLHSYQPLLVHGDLKPRNILIDRLGRARICDFGLARIFLNEGSSGMTTTTHHTGTERYLAYELVLAGEDAIPTTASDIHAVGCIGLEFLFSQIPYSARRNNLGGMIFVDIRAGVPPAERPAELPPELEYTWTHLEMCWDLDPYNRPSASTLLMWLEWEADSLFARTILPQDLPDEWDFEWDFEEEEINSLQEDCSEASDSERHTDAPDPDVSSSTEGSLSPLAPYQLSFSTNYVVSRFWPLLDALDKHSADMGARQEGDQRLLLSYVEGEFPPSALARIKLSFKDYVGAATRQDIVIMGGSGEHAWIAMKEWSYPGEGPTPPASITLSDSKSPPASTSGLSRYDISWFWPLFDALENAHAQAKAAHAYAHSFRISIIADRFPASARERIGLSFEEYVAIGAKTGTIVVGGAGEYAWVAMRDWEYPGKMGDGERTLRAKSSTWRSMARKAGWTLE